MIAKFLLLDESIDRLMNIGDHVLQVAMKSIAHGQHGKGDVIYKSRSHVAQRAGSELIQTRVVQVFSDQIV